MQVTMGTEPLQLNRKSTIGSSVKVSASVLEETQQHQREGENGNSKTKIQPSPSSFSVPPQRVQKSDTSRGTGSSRGESRTGRGKDVLQVKTLIQKLLSAVGLLLWFISTINSVFDPAKTVYGYYLYTDSDNQHAVWELTVHNTFTTTALPCAPDEFSGCYYELPVYGTGSLAGGTCRSYYPLDKAPNQHIGNFFGNCTKQNSEEVWIPSEHYATTQWSVQTSSTSKACLERVGEGTVFPCDSYTTMNGRVINYRISRTEASKWCREFGGYYILDKARNIQEVLIGNVSLGKLAFTSLNLTYERPVFNIEELIGCSADVHIGGTATHITTHAWYGDTAAPWTARTTSTAKSNVLTWSTSDNVAIETLHYSEGDLTQVRSWYKDYARVIILLIVVIYRSCSIYYPLYLSFIAQSQSFLHWVTARSLGLVIHKRERRNLTILTLLAFETIMSIEDIVMFCQQLIYTSGTEYYIVVLKNMSIARIIWPCALILRLLTIALNSVVPTDYSIDLAEDLFLITLPVVWIYIPAYVSTKGMDLFQGYSWVGTVVRHFANSIVKVYSDQLSYIKLYYVMFGRFTLYAVLVVGVISILQTCLMRNGSLLAYLFSGFNKMHLRNVGRKGDNKAEGLDCSLRGVLQRSRCGFAKGEAYQMTRARLPTAHCESMNMAAEGFVMLQYGPHRVLGYVSWFTVRPVVDMEGHVAVIVKDEVRYDCEVTEAVLLTFSSYPAVLGVPDLL